MHKEPDRTRLGRCESELYDHMWCARVARCMILRTELGQVGATFRQLSYNHLNSPSCVRSLSTPPYDISLKTTITGKPPPLHNAIIYFAIAAVAIDSSHTTASSSASWSRFSPPSDFCYWARVDNVVHSLSLATITGRWFGETAFVQVSTTWALTCPETVHHRP